MYSCHERSASAASGATLPWCPLPRLLLRLARRMRTGLRTGLRSRAASAAPVPSAARSAAASATLAPPAAGCLLPLALGRHLAALGLLLLLLVLLLLVLLLLCIRAAALLLRILLLIWLLLLGAALPLAPAGAPAPSAAAAALAVLQHQLLAPSARDARHGLHSGGMKAGSPPAQQLGSASLVVHTSWHTGAARRMDLGHVAVSPPPADTLARPRPPTFCRRLDLNLAKRSRMVRKESRVSWVCEGAAGQGSEQEGGRRRASREEAVLLLRLWPERSLGATARAEPAPSPIQAAQPPGTGSRRAGKGKDARPPGAARTPPAPAPAPPPSCLPASRTRRRTGGAAPPCRAAQR